MKYLPVCYSNHDMRLPEMNWQCSVSCDMFNFADETPYKVFWQSEPNDISGLQEKLIRNHKFYDLILTWNTNVLSECPNARYFATGNVWNQNPDTSQKQFQVSYLTSQKNMCSGHQYRLDIFEALPNIILNNKLPVVKHKSPPWLENKLSLLSPFQYSIIMENAQWSNYFTEKILDAFATKTIPIYWGCPNIQDFFNKKGILSWNGTADLLEHLTWVSPGYYQTQTEAIEDNYQRALKYTDRTNELVRAIERSWTPDIKVVHSGLPNEETK
jgi:hypothetical protein